MEGCRGLFELVGPFIYSKHKPWSHLVFWAIRKNSFLADSRKVVSKKKAKTQRARMLFLNWNLTWKITEKCVKGPFMTNDWNAILYFFAKMHSYIISFHNHKSCPQFHKALFYLFFYMMFIWKCHAFFQPYIRYSLFPTLSLFLLVKIKYIKTLF